MNDESWVNAAKRVGRAARQTFADDYGVFSDLDFMSVASKEHEIIRRLMQGWLPMDAAPASEAKNEEEVENIKRLLDRLYAYMSGRITDVAKASAILSIMKFVVQVKDSLDDIEALETNLYVLRGIMDAIVESLNYSPLAFELINVMRDKGISHIRQNDEKPVFTQVEDLLNVRHE